MKKSETQWSSEVFEAIDECIERWEQFAEGEVENCGAQQCALCQMFLIRPDVRNEVGCRNCPIGQCTTKISCASTPYHLFGKHFTDYHKLFYYGPKRVLCPICEKLALDEVKFLREVRDWMKPVKTPKTLRLKIADNDVIGKDPISIHIVDGNGVRISQGSLLSISEDGELIRHTSVFKAAGIKLDYKGRIEEIEG